MNIKQCSLCSMTWIDNVPYWSYSNTPTTNANVYSIVCRHAKPRDGKVCSNPCNNSEGATDSWESRRRLIENSNIETSLDYYKSTYSEFFSEDSDK